MKHLLSIIIPCYNCQKTLEEAVQSCFKQGLENFEIVMVDDGSTDNTREVIQRLATEHPEIRTITHEENKGGGAARNTAVENSNSDVIFCLDSDDVLPPNTLSKMLTFLNEKKCDGVTIHRSIKFSGSDTKNIHHIDAATCLNEKISLGMMLSKNKEFAPIYVNFMYTKSAFSKLGGYPVSHGYDTQGFAWRFICSGLSAYVCPDTEYLHRINFSESYFLREYNNGKINYNWRDILLEHYYVFTKDSIDFICKFDCRDFTRNLMDELVGMDGILVKNFESTFGLSHPPYSNKLSDPVYIQRSSLLGRYFRVKCRIRLMLKNENKKTK